MIKINNKTLTVEEAFEDLPLIAKKVGKTVQELIAFMKYSNMYIDEQNITENGFNNIKEIEEWWKNKTDFEIFKIYEEYDGISELLEMDVQE